MFDYESSGLWYTDGARATGMSDPDELPLSEATKKRLAAWVQRLDELNVQTYTGGGPPPKRSTWAAADEEKMQLWRVLREEAGPEWAVGIQTKHGVAWDEAEP
jgi:hypothetical protein